MEGPPQNCLGDELDPVTLALLKRVTEEKDASAVSGDEAAQIHELAFWRGVAIHGYQGMAAKYFPQFQKKWMLSCFTRTRWDPASLKRCALVEIGCGPLGMIEFLPGQYKVACDPLNQHYGRLFRHVRSREISYYTELDELLGIGRGKFDVAICFNVLDHTRASRELFDAYMSLLRDGGRFLFQVNTVKDGEPRDPDHARMHPSTFTVEKIRSWIDEYSRDYQVALDSQASGLNEYFFMAFGSKNRRPG